MLHTESRPSKYLDYIHPQELVMQNRFRYAGIEQANVPTFAEARPLLPEPYWDGHEDAINCYWKVWELAFANIKKTSPDNGFIAHYIHSAFNENLFAWDSVFIQFFARYGGRAFDFHRTLDNFYHRQHRDGFICRELLPIPGGEMFHRHDPGSTGPNVLAWCEWEHFLNCGDHERLAQVFPVNLAYHRWLRRHRTWQNGSYWHCGLSSGMDNQDRIGCGRDDTEVRVSHGHLSWVDANAQALLSACCLVDMARELGRLDEVDEEQQEIKALHSWINAAAWDEAIGFYFDVDRNGRTTGFKSIAAFWTLLAGAVPAERRGRLLAWLNDPATFNLFHRVPSLAGDARGYDATGGYWRGGVFPPTTYMVLRGLTAAGYDGLAYDIACNHHHNVVEVFKQTGTVWEYYAPAGTAPGERPDRPAIKDLVGWSGLGPVAVLLEYCFGLRPYVIENRLVWDVRETGAFGVERYPFGRKGLIDLRCAARRQSNQKPDVEIKSTCHLILELRWPGGSETREIAPTEQ
ncbi:MAG: trehalase family glycosidase [Chloroflexota bacterium]